MHRTKKRKLSNDLASFNGEIVMSLENLPRVEFSKEIKTSQDLFLNLWRYLLLLFLDKYLY